MDSLKKYLENHPSDLKNWLDQFPWESFETEITIDEDKVERVVVAKKVTLQTNAEITGLLICQDAEIGEGAEIHGTMVCGNGMIGKDAECNYLISRIIEIGEDAEIRSAIILESLKVENGAEVDELEILESTFIDLHNEGIIKKEARLPVQDLNKAIGQRLEIVLETAIRELEALNR